MSVTKIVLLILMCVFGLTGVGCFFPGLRRAWLEDRAKFWFGSDGRKYLNPFGYFFFGGLFVVGMVGSDELWMRAMYAVAALVQFFVSLFLQKRYLSPTVQIAAGTHPSGGAR